MRKNIPNYMYSYVHVQDKNYKLLFTLMRIATIISFVVVFAIQANANGYAQTITLNVKNTSLKNVFMLIKQQTGYSFFWKEELLEHAPNVDLDLKSVSIQQALNSSLSGTSLSYDIKGKIIYITNSPTSNNKQIAQTKDITGIVLSSLDNKPIVASIMIKGTTKGTISNNEGKFSIKANEGDVLIISSIGYIPQNITVNSEVFYQVKLLENTNNGVDSVVVTAYGIKSRSRAVAFAVTSINNSQLTNAGTDNVTNSLAGKLPGVDIASMGAGPMMGSRINLRGLNSLSGSSRPLIVVNGVPVLDNDVSWGGRGFGQVLKGSTIDDINPNDIESITTLNGANAAALYGSSGMNGALVITTKSGKESKGIGIDYSMNLTQSSIYGLPDFQEEYGAGSTADRFDVYTKNVPGYDSLPFYAPKGTGVATSGIAFGPKLEGQKVLWWDGKIRPWVAQHNNYKDFYNNGLSMNHTIGISGADEKSSYRLSGSFYDYKGYLPNMRESRYSLLFSGSRKISKIISSDIYFNYTYNYRQNPPERIDRANYSILPSDITSLYKANTINSQGYLWTDSASKYVAGSNIANNILLPLVWDPIMDRYQDGRNTLIGTFTITIQPSKLLSIRLRAGTNRLYDQVELKQPFQAYALPTDYTTSQGGYSKSMESDYVNHADGIVTYNNNFKHNISLNVYVGYSMDDYNYENNTVASANGLMFNNMYSVANFKSRQIGTTTYTGANSTGTQSGSRIMAGFGSATLGYKNWLYLTLTDREDWSSYLLEPNNRINYPSIGASFIFSDALKMPTFINFGKLRASYGEVGYFGTNYSSNTNYSYSSFNSAVTSNYQSTTTAYGIGLKPQKNKSYEFGLETGMWDDRLRTNITYYINKTFQTIIPVPVAYSTGGATRVMNAGTLQNKGIEIQIIGAIIRNKNFQWNMTLNGTSISRKVLALAPGLPSLQLANTFGAVEKAVVGGSPMDIYMLTLQRDPTTKKILVGDDGMPEWSSTQSKVGNMLPKIYGGYINSLNYKNWTLSFLLEYKFGGQVVSYNNQFWTATGLTKNTLAGRDAAHGGVSYYVQGGNNIQLTAGSTAPDGAFVYHDGIIFNGIHEDGSANTTVVQASTYYQNRYYAFGTQDAVFNNNYLRLREVSFGYSLPTSVANKLHLKSLSASLIARNLFFIFKTLPYDNPDNSLGTGDFSSGILYTSYPLMRNLGLSINVGF